MNKISFSQVFRILSLVCAAVVLFAEEMSAQSTSDGARRDVSTDTSYFFYQQSDYPRDCHEVLSRCSSDVNSSGVYYIKPEGYKEPFEVYCDNEDDSGGWTLIQNRHANGSIGFLRNWESYKEGFGFLSHDFWLGNEKLSFLTNQKNYELVIEMIISNGTAFAVSYNNFRIGDEYSDYTLISLVQNYIENPPISWYPPGLYYGNCTCGRRTCEDPETCINTCAEGESEYFLPCPEGFFMKGDDCVPQRECGCYVEEERIVVPEGHDYVSPGCTRRSLCSNGEISQESYTCDANALCTERRNSRKCVCSDGYTGNGRICRLSVTVSDCQYLHNAGIRDNGVYAIKPTNWNDPPFDVYCNMTDDAGWTVFQRRMDGSVDFYLDWASYKAGFGNMTTEFWLGNDKLYYLTNQKSYRMRIDLVNAIGAPYYAEYSSFGISNEANKYSLSELGTFSGTAKYDAMSPHRNRPFTTKDRDNDANSVNCAETSTGAWWYDACAFSNLNGNYTGSGDHSIEWAGLPGGRYNIKYSEMKISPE